jgi:20S proteasome alpha/beta subunit
LEVDVTLCIAALSNDWDLNVNHPPLRNIVCCFDKRVETTTAGSDTAYKFRKVSANWAALIAGTVSRAEELITIYTTNLPTDVTPEPALLEILRQPPQILKRRLADEYVQNRLGVSYTDFLANGSSWLPTAVFEHIASEIMRIEIGCQLILLPMPPQQTKFLFTVDGDGAVYPENDFAAIGTGATGATAWLHHRAQHRFNSTNTTVRQVIEAKKFCETAPGVGHTTNLVVLTHDRQIRHHGGSESVFDRMWTKYGPRRATTEFNIDDIPTNTHTWEDTAIG